MIGVLYFLIGFVGFFLFMRWKRKGLLDKAVVPRSVEPTLPTRDLSTVAFSGAAELKQEEIKSGGPLKPKHRRLALRDTRLLPKPPPKPYRYGDPKPPVIKYFTRGEARRLFSGSFRTNNRNVRDLAIDVDQLQRYDLPVWKSDADIAVALGISLRALQHLSVHRARERISHYVTFAIPKRNGGGERIIHAPKRRLKAVLRKLNALVLKKLPVSDAAHGFVSGRSIATNARPHVGKAVVMRFDIKDCFPSIHFGRVRGLFLSLGYSYPVANSLALVMTESPRQHVEAEGRVYNVPVGPRVCVQGAPTSPALCNAVLMKLDHRLAGLAKKHGFDYTRYADDLTFSGNDLSQITLFLKLVPRIVAEEGFAINAEKTRVMRQASRQTVAGVIVNKDMGLSRKTRRVLRAAIHHERTQPSGDVHRQRQLHGVLAYLYMLNPKQAQALMLPRREREPPPPFAP